MEHTSRKLYKSYINVSSLTHLGGAAVGVLFWYFTRDE